MTQHPTPLGDTLASLRSAPLGTHRGMLPAALHTLITAILTRIFARLEQVFLLWQAGQLPAPTVRHRAPNLPAEARPSHHNTPAPREPRQRNAPARDPQQVRAPTPPNRIRPGHPPRRANPRAATAGSRPCRDSVPAHASRRRISLIPRRQSRHLIVTITQLT